MSLARKKALCALTLSIAAIAGCAKAPSQTPAPPPGEQGPVIVNPNGLHEPPPDIVPPCPQPGLWNADCRFIAFSACRNLKFLPKLEGYISATQVVTNPDGSTASVHAESYASTSGSGNSSGAAGIEATAEGDGSAAAGGGTDIQTGDWSAESSATAYAQAGGAQAGVSTSVKAEYFVRPAGSLFLWDEAVHDVYILNGALAGLNDDATSLNATNKEVRGPGSCSELEQLNPLAFADGKVLFSWGHEVYYWDMVSESRVTVAFDGQSERYGGPRATVSADGLLLAYVSNKGTVVLKETDGAYFTKTRELTKIAAEANALFNDGYHYDKRRGVIYDLGLSGDGRWMVVNIDGLLYLYDVINPHLFQLLPLSGEALAGRPDRIGHVAINFDGRFIAFTVNHRPVDQQYEPGRFDTRLLVLDRQSGLIDTVPYANLGDTISGADRKGKDIILDPLFCNDGRSLLFETSVGGNFRIWKYDMLTETLRGMVILNNALGDLGTDVLISDPVLDP
ncbi:MAG TPA: hypothetical protein V6D00_07195 [Pantanalinema sp.]